MDGLFLTLDEIVEIHHNQRERHGGLSGIRDHQLLAQAIAMPAARRNGQLIHRDHYERAAAYMYHLQHNHGFLDGDLRTGVIAGLVYLTLNHVEVELDGRAFSRLIQASAEGVAGKTEIAAYLRAHGRIKKTDK